MKLHQDINAFRVLLEQIHERTGYRTDVLEKDYYVVLMLRELAEKQKAGLPAYFKGGTALYKALKTTNRFSEFPLTPVDAAAHRMTGGWNRPPRNMPRSTVTLLPAERTALK